MRGLEDGSIHEVRGRVGRGTPFQHVTHSFRKRRARYFISTLPLHAYTHAHTPRRPASHREGVSTTWRHSERGETRVRARGAVPGATLSGWAASSAFWKSNTLNKQSNKKGGGPISFTIWWMARWNALGLLPCWWCSPVWPSGPYHLDQIKPL